MAKKRKHFIRYEIEPFGKVFHTRYDADRFYSWCGRSTTTMYGFTKDGTQHIIKEKYW